MTKLLLAGAAGTTAASLGHGEEALAADSGADETITGTWTFDPASGRLKIANGVEISFGDGMVDGARVSITGTGQGLQLDNSLIVRKDETDEAAPEIILKAKNGGWLSGIDVAAAIAARDLVVAAKLNYPKPGNVNDFLYCSHNGSDDPTLGIGKAQPGTAYRTWIVGWTQSENREMGTLRLQAGRRQTGKVLALTDWGGHDRIWVDPSDWSLVIEGERLSRDDIVALKKLLRRHERPAPVVRGRRGRSALRHLLAKLDELGIIRNRTR